jgi:hypothetical protein
MVFRFEGSTAEVFVVAFVAFAELLSSGVTDGMGVVVSSGVVVITPVVATEPSTPGAGVVLFARGRPAPCPSRQDPVWHGNPAASVSVPF